MKAAEFIQIVREDTKELYDMHLLSVQTNGEQGLRCLNPDVLREKLVQTDKQILQHYLSLGAEIEDAEEFLAGQS